MVIAAGLVFASLFAVAESNAEKALEKFKSMAGSWEGKSPNGGSEQVSYQLQAGGTAVMADMHMGEEAMTSMFYVDHDQLLMTHFCPSNNQPRMKATISPDLKMISFDFLDATNLQSPQAGHMHHAVYLFSDADHYSEEWTWKQGDKESKMHFEMQRKK